MSFARIRKAQQQPRGPLAPQALNVTEGPDTQQQTKFMLAQIEARYQNFGHQGGWRAKRLKEKGEGETGSENRRASANDSEAIAAGDDKDQSNSSMRSSPPSSFPDSPDAGVGKEGHRRQVSQGGRSTTLPPKPGESSQQLLASSEAQVASMFATASASSSASAGGNPDDIPVDNSLLKPRTGLDPPMAPRNGGPSRLIREARVYEAIRPSDSQPVVASPVEDTSRRTPPLSPRSARGGEGPMSRRPSVTTSESSTLQPLNTQLFPEQAGADQPLSTASAGSSNAGEGVLTPGTDKSAASESRLKLIAAKLATLKPGHQYRNLDSFSSNGTLPAKLNESSAPEDKLQETLHAPPASTTSASATSGERESYRPLAHVPADSPRSSIAAMNKVQSTPEPTSMAHENLKQASGPSVTPITEDPAISSIVPNLPALGRLNTLKSTVGLRRLASPEESRMKDAETREKPVEPDAPSGEGLRSHRRQVSSVSIASLGQLAGHALAPALALNQHGPPVTLEFSITPDGRTLYATLPYDFRPRSVSVAPSGNPDESVKEPPSPSVSSRGAQSHHKFGTLPPVNRLVPGFFKQPFLENLIEAPSPTSQKGLKEFGSSLPRHHVRSSSATALSSFKGMSALAVPQQSPLPSDGSQEVRESLLTPASALSPTTPTPEDDASSAAESPAVVIKPAPDPETQSAAPELTALEDHATQSHLPDAVTPITISSPPDAFEQPTSVVSKDSHVALAALSANDAKLSVLSHQLALCEARLLDLEEDYAHAKHGWSGIADKWSGADSNFEMLSSDLKNVAETLELSRQAHDFALRGIEVKIKVLKSALEDTIAKQQEIVSLIANQFVSVADLFTAQQVRMQKIETWITHHQQYFKRPNNRTQAGRMGLNDPALDSVDASFSAADDNGIFRLGLNDLPTSASSVLIKQRSEALKAIVESGQENPEQTGQGNDDLKRPLSRKKKKIPILVDDGIKRLNPVLARALRLGKNNIGDTDIFDPEIIWTDGELDDDTTNGGAHEDREEENETEDEDDTSSARSQNMRLPSARGVRRKSKRSRQSAAQLGERAPGQDAILASIQIDEKVPFYSRVWNSISIDSPNPFIRFLAGLRIYCKDIFSFCAVCFFTGIVQLIANCTAFLSATNEAVRGTVFFSGASSVLSPLNAFFGELTERAKDGAERAEAESADAYRRRLYAERKLGIRSDLRDFTQEFRREEIPEEPEPRTFYGAGNPNDGVSGGLKELEPAVAVTEGQDTEASITGAKGGALPQASSDATLMTPEPHVNRPGGPLHASQAGPITPLYPRLATGGVAALTSGLRGRQKLGAGHGVVLEDDGLLYMTPAPHSHTQIPSMESSDRVAPLKSDFHELVTPQPQPHQQLTSGPMVTSRPLRSPQSYGFIGGGMRSSSATTVQRRVLQTFGTLEDNDDDDDRI